MTTETKENGFKSYAKPATAFRLILRLGNATLPLLDPPDDQDHAVQLGTPQTNFDNPLPIVLAKDGTLVLFSHPLAALGLKPDGAYEVKNSSWARESYGGKGRHYVFAFRDAMFECCGSETIDEDDDAVRVMSRRLYR